MRSIDLSMRPKLLVAIFLLLGSNFLAAQGLLFDPKVYDKLPAQPLYGDGGKSESTELNGVFKIDLKPFCPKPQNQGTISSCTAWACGYGAMSIAYAIQQKKEGDIDAVTDSAFSALFLYNMARDSVTDCGLGTFIHKTLDILKEKGNLRNAYFDKGNNCKRLPTTKELNLAKAHRIKDWVSLFNSTSSNRVRIDKTKLSLAAKKPVMIGMRLRNNFMELGPKDKFWLPTVGDTALNYNHAMVVVGFDDGKGAFEIMNSWGEKWGNNGFFWVRYEDYARHVTQAFQMTIHSNDAPKNNVPTPTKPENTLAGEFAIRYVKEIRDTNIIFQNASFVQQQKGLYQLQEAAAWPVGKLFQLTATNFVGGSYLYVFSLDAENKIKVHWPRDGRLDDKFEGLNESAVITNSHVNLVVPGPKSGLKLEKTGDEYIGILVSKDPLPNFNALLQAISTNTKIPVKDRMDRALGAMVIKSETVDFTADNIQFSTADTKGKVLSLLLKIPVKP